MQSEKLLSAKSLTALEKRKKGESGGGIKEGEVFFFQLIQTDHEYRFPLRDVLPYSFLLLLLFLTKKETVASEGGLGVGAIKG